MTCFAVWIRESFTVIRTFYSFFLLTLTFPLCDLVRSVGTAKKGLTKLTEMYDGVFDELISLSLSNVASPPIMRSLVNATAK